MRFLCVRGKFCDVSVTFANHSRARARKAHVPHGESFKHHFPVFFFQEIISLRKHFFILLQGVKILTRHLRKGNIEKTPPVLGGFLNKFQFRGIEKYGIHVAEKFADLRHRNAVDFDFLVLIAEKSDVNVDFSESRNRLALDEALVRARHNQLFVASGAGRITRAKVKNRFRAVGFALGVRAAYDINAVRKFKRFLGIISEVFKF